MKRRWWRIAVNSLRFQLLSRSLLLLAVLLVMVGVLQYFVMREFVYNNKAQSVRNEIMTVPRDIWPRFASMPFFDGQGRRPLLFLPESSIAFIDADGNYSALTNWPEDTAPPELAKDEYLQALQGRSYERFRLVKDAAGMEQLLVFQRIESHDKLLGIVQVSTSTKPLNAILFKQLFTFMSLAAAALLIGLLTFLPVLRRTLVPLSKIIGTVEQIDAGKLDVRLPLQQGQQEIDSLAQSFNGMLKRLESSFEAEKEAKEQMRRFIADASHELRTPLTSIHGFLEVLLRGASSRPDQLEKALKSMYGESERINKLVNDLLLLAKLDRTPTIQLEESRLDALLLEMEPQLRILAGGRKVEFAVAEVPACRMDRDKMKQVVLNLYHNAVQHTDPVHGHIVISLDAVDGAVEGAVEGAVQSSAKKAAGGDVRGSLAGSAMERVVELAVRDNGPGIARDHLPHLFDRFYRSDTSRTRMYGGAGLGLSITKAIVEMHHGSIRVDSEVGRGSVFRIRLPASGA